MRHVPLVGAQGHAGVHRVRGLEGGARAARRARRARTATCRRRRPRSRSARRCAPACRITACSASRRICARARSGSTSRVKDDAGALAVAVTVATTTRATAVPAGLPERRVASCARASSMQPARRSLARRRVRSVACSSTRAASRSAVLAGDEGRQRHAHRSRRQLATTTFKLADRERRHRRGRRRLSRLSDAVAKQLGDHRGRGACRWRVQRSRSAARCRSRSA